jgi:hypothetical protein
MLVYIFGKSLVQSILIGFIAGNTMLGSYASHQQQNNLEIASRIHGKIMHKN